jgi:hypothetical protein
MQARRIPALRSIFADALATGFLSLKRDSALEKGR